MGVNICVCLRFAFLLAVETGDVREADLVAHVDLESEPELIANHGTNAEVVVVQMVERTEVECVKWRRIGIDRRSGRRV